MYDQMKISGQITKEILVFLKNITIPGVTTNFINIECKKQLDKYGAISAAYQYGQNPFPGYLCISVNNEICHGIPSDKILKNGDLVSMDLCLSKDGYYGDSCISFTVGKENKQNKKIINAAYKTMMKGIENIKDGVSVYQISKILEDTANQYGYAVATEFCGHGIGKKLHCDPMIPFFPNQEDKNNILKAGQYITIEPMLVQCNLKKYKRAPISICPKDHWTAKSIGLSAQFEHTILVTTDGYEIITQ